jgi:3-oxoadipate enol-lactonase
MVSLAIKFNLTKFIACGSSMGSATSLYAAINYPELVTAVIMMRPPTAWKDRSLRRKKLLSSAIKCQESSKQGELHHFVIRGTAFSDLPSLEDVDSYKKIKCPLLILTVQGDDSHPISTAESIKSLVPQAELFISGNHHEATQSWPTIIRQFLQKLRNIEK